MVTPSMDPPRQPSPAPRVAVVGLGRGGGRIAAILAAECMLPTIRVAAADTDAADLKSLEIGKRIELGNEWTYGEGCGGDAALGERATNASADEMRQFIDGSRLLVVLAGLGRGTGGGGAKALARLANDMNVPSLFIVTLPFSFEGGAALREADRALALLRGYTPAVVAVPNDLLFERLPPDTPANVAFPTVDRLLAEGAAGLACIASAQALVPTDMASIKAILGKARASSALACGNGSGPKAARQAVDSFLESPFVGGAEKLADVDAAVLILVGGTDLSVGLIRECLKDLQRRLPPRARILVGAYTEERMAGEVRLTGVFCRYERFPDAGEALPPETDASTRSAGKKGRKKSRRKMDAEKRQGLLPLLEQSAGVFSGAQATTYNGENLDVPTFQRRGIRIDLGNAGSGSG